MNEDGRGFLDFLVNNETSLELGGKRRRDVRSLLHHAVRLDRCLSQRVTGSDAFLTAIEGMVGKRGAPTNCYVLAANGDPDGRELSVREPLGELDGMGEAR